MIKANAVIGQSGGPTCAINATLAGVIDALLKSEKISKIFGTVNGINGILSGNLKELNKIFREQRKIYRFFKKTRRRRISVHAVLSFPNLKKIRKFTRTFFASLKKHNIKYFFYIGGNDSMDTVMKLNAYAKKFDKGVTVMGIPKTIDNDLFGTDHCPGFGSAAKYVAASVAEIARDAYCYFVDSVTIVEIMGRNAGFLTAASALARSEKPMRARPYISSRAPV
ncbi:MAG: 6-phosphofructokinase [Clostridiales bacterium]|nr:MAG: 6-phosphofructokinase [Clostridiales bacterium]